MSNLGVWLQSTEDVYKRIDHYNPAALKDVFTTEPFASTLEKLNVRPSKQRIRTIKVKTALMEAVQKHPGPNGSVKTWVNNQIITWLIIKK